MQYLMMVKGLTIWHAAIIAVLAVALAVFFLQRGILHTLLWLVAVAALAIGAVNKVSYG